MDKQNECAPAPKAKVVMTEEFLLKFALMYNALKAQALYPVEIRDRMLEHLSVCNSTYYKYLRAAREKGFITDSYDENQARSQEARAKWLLDNGGRITGVKFSFPALSTRKSFVARAVDTIRDIGRKLFVKM